MPNISLDSMVETIKNSQEAVVIIGFIGLCILLYLFKFRYEVEGYRIYHKEKKIDWTNIALVLAAAFVIKAALAVHFEGHGTDMNCFYAWSDMIWENGIGKFYYLDAFTDYPPGYMFLLWIIAGIRQLFHVETSSDMGRLLIKLFPIIFDLATAFLIYILSKKKFSEGSSLLFAALYALNPLVVLDSSNWGQTDGAFTFFVLLTCYLCMEKKRIPAYFVYVVGVLIKPQALLFAPILIYTIIDQVFLQDFKWQKFWKDLIWGLGAIGAMFLMILPFGIGKVLTQYTETMTSYEYCTINAYNIWALFGKNWVDQSETFLGIAYSNWGKLAIVAALALSAWVFFKKLKDQDSKYYVSMAIISATMFLFSVRMHERYLFPVVGLTLMAFLVRPSKEMFFTFVGFTTVSFMNVAHVLYAFVEENENTGPNGGILGITALLTLGVYGYMFFALRRETQIEPMKEVGGKGKKNKNYTEKK
ncbi:MAG: glycosyltransferase 87 family protein, partial [Eubacterium sp.]|nr:glycosyltransferase 87 family protein [Eubacterium sp.]